MPFGLFHQFLSRVPRGVKRISHWRDLRQFLYRSWTKVSISPAINSRFTYTCRNVNGCSLITLCSILSVLTVIMEEVYFILSIVEQQFQVKLLAQYFNKITITSEKPCTLETCLEIFSFLTIIFGRYLSTNFSSPSRLCRMKLSQLLRACFLSPIIS